MSRQPFKDGGWGLSRQQLLAITLKMGSSGRKPVAMPITKSWEIRSVRQLINKTNRTFLKWSIRNKYWSCLWKRFEYDTRSVSSTESERHVHLLIITRMNILLICGTKKWNYTKKSTDITLQSTSGIYCSELKNHVSDFFNNLNFCFVLFVPKTCSVPHPVP